MKFIENVNFAPLEKPKFVQPMLMRYTQEGTEKSWELAKVHDSVSVLIYHKEHHSFVLVKQFRPPVYLSNNNGYTYELCAGICDKKLTLSEIVREEMIEETGYEVTLEKLEKITAFYTAVGFAGSKQTLFYAEVDERMRGHQGGGVEEEAIEVVEIPVDEARKFIYNEEAAKTPGLIFAFMWWFDRFLPK